MERRAGKGRDTLKIRVIKATGHLGYSERNLTDVRSYLESGDALNWVPDKLEVAVYWAMEAWLLMNDYDHEPVPPGLIGWYGVSSAFRKHAPDALAAELLTCLAKATSLEYFLFGSGIEEEENLPSLDEWKIMAHECLDRTDHAFDQLYEDLKLPRSKGYLSVEF